MRCDGSISNCGRGVDCLHINDVRTGQIAAEALPDTDTVHAYLPKRKKASGRGVAFIPGTCVGYPATGLTARAGGEGLRWFPSVGEQVEEHTPQGEYLVDHVRSQNLEEAHSGAGVLARCLPQFIDQVIGGVQGECVHVEDGGLRLTGR